MFSSILLALVTKLSPTGVLTRKLHFVETYWYCLVLFIMSKNNLIGKLNIKSQQKLQCSSEDIRIIYKKKTYKNICDFLTAHRYLLNSTAKVSPRSELVKKRQRLWFDNLFFQNYKKKVKLAIFQEKDIINSNKVKSPVKRKSKLTNRSSRENDKKGKKSMRDKADDEKKNI